MIKQKEFTALKAYLQRNQIKATSLAKSCKLSEGYLSNILNAHCTKPRLPVLVRIATELNLPLNTIHELLDTTYESYLAEEYLSEIDKTNFFRQYLNQILDASEQNNYLLVSNLAEVIRIEVSDAIPLKSPFLSWFKAYNLTFQNKFELAIPLFLNSLSFVPRFQIEKRFKAKVLLGLGTAYLARGRYNLSLKAFRQSLILWSEGYQAARVYMNMGTVYRRLAKNKLSFSMYEKAYEMGTGSIKLYSIAGLIQLKIDNEDYISARKWVIRGYKLAKCLQSPRGKGDIYCNIAEYYFLIDNLHRSEVYFRKAIRFSITSSDLRTKQWAELGLALLYLKQGFIKEFDILIRKIETQLLDVEDILLIAKNFNILGIKYLRNGEYSQSISISEKAYNLLISLNLSKSKELIESCRLLYKGYSLLKEPKPAQFYLTEIKRLTN